jgi:hypothetical protein
MRGTSISALLRLMVPLAAFGMLGCNLSNITGDDDADDNEVRVTVEAVGADFLDARDNFRYLVDSATEYEGLQGLSDVAVGDVVEIEYASISSTERRALEIEADGADED